MSSDVVRWTKIELIDNHNTTKKYFNKMKGITNMDSHCRSDKYSSFMSVHFSIVCKLIFLLFVIQFNLVLVLCDDVMDAPVAAHGHYTPTWAVHIEGGSDMADAVAREHGFVNMGQVCGFFIVLF